MHQFSDSDTTDSDEGIRFKTDSTRNKESNNRSSIKRQQNSSSRKRSRSKSLERRRDRGREDDRNNKDKDRRSYSRNDDRRNRRNSRERCARHNSSDKNSYRRSNRSPSNDSKRRKESHNRRSSSHTKSTTASSETKRERTKEPVKSTKIEAKSEKLHSVNQEIIKEDINLTFGPVLPPKTMSVKSDATIEENKDISSNRLHRTSKTRLVEKLEDTSESSNKTITKIVASPISSNNDSEHENDDGLLNTETYGPVLPDKYDKDVIEIEDSDAEINENEDAYGPKLPSNTLTDKDNANNSASQDFCDPPVVKKKEVEKDAPEERVCVGPELPIHLRQELLEKAEMNGEHDVTDDEPEEGEIVGPVLPGSNLSAAHIALEERALQYKLDQLTTSSDPQVTSREDWMLTLPSAAAKIGLGPRQFRAKAGPDMTDRSSWTDTPLDKAEKLIKEVPVDNGVDLREEAEKVRVKERDREQESMARKHKKRKKDRKERSLLEMHQEKIKKAKKEEEDGANIRRPFNRDTDLKVNQFDDAQKKAIYKKAQLLDTRFSKGESKYL